MPTDPSSTLISSGLSLPEEANKIIADYVKNMFTTTGITKDIFDIATNSTINNYISKITNITTLIYTNSKQISTISEKLSDNTSTIQNKLSSYKSYLDKLDTYFDDSSASIGRYNDSLEIYNLKLLENILYSIGIIILIYKMIGWNININL